MPSVADILGSKDSKIVAVSPSMTVLEATQLMNQHRIGSVCVVDENSKLIGVFSERDVLTRIVASERDPKNTLVGEVMTAAPTTCDNMIELDDVAEMMRDRRVRHIPVIDDCGKVQGMISIGDLNAFRVSQQEAHIQMLSEYVYGRS